MAQLRFYPLITAKLNTRLLDNQHLFRRRHFPIYYQLIKINTAGTSIAAWIRVKHDLMIAFPEIVVDQIGDFLPEIIVYTYLGMPISGKWKPDNGLRIKGIGIVVI